MCFLHRPLECDRRLPVILYVEKGVEPLELCFLMLPILGHREAELLGTAIRRLPVLTRGLLAVLVGGRKVVDARIHLPTFPLCLTQVYFASLIFCIVSTRPTISSLL